MIRKSLAVLLLVAASPALTSAAPQSHGSGSGTTTTGQSRSQRVVAAPDTVRVRQAPDAQPANVRLDILINDQSGLGQPLRKSISLLIANLHSGRVRSSGTITQQFVAPGMATPDGKPLVNLRPVGHVELNVDASVELLENDKIRSEITLQYTPGASTPLPVDSVATPSPLNQSVTVILTNGKPLVITQAADPLSDRKITVEVTATILR
jgi:hypothetical protein